MKVCNKCNAEIYTKDGENTCPGGCKRQKKKTGLTRKDYDALMRDLGLTRVRGAMGGTYYE